MQLSIIVTVHNTTDYIVQALDSITKQESYNTNDIEVIIVDDKSTDNTLNIIKELPNWNEFVIIENKKSLGPGQCRNIGISYAKGEYIAYLDGDDYISSNYLSVIVPYLRLAKYDVFVFDYSRFYDNDGLVYYTSSVDKDIDKQYTAAWNKVVKSDVARQAVFLSDNIKWEDVYYTVVLNQNINSIKLISEPLYFYRRRAGSLSNNVEDIRGHGDISIIFDKLTYLYTLEYLAANKQIRKLLNKQLYTHLALIIMNNEGELDDNSLRILDNIVEKFWKLNKKNIPFFGVGFLRWLKNMLIILLVTSGFRKVVKRILLMFNN
ncbi:glycosyltransferase family 2 protein [Leuconostoc mesenteroides]|uniref:glycosyltransferase family 2 protein n=1 Tax=Leuconostoc mesenteroides TaxID=1245 RepID=UPI0032DFC981